MKSFKSAMKYFSLGEILLWSFSVILIVMSFCLFDKENYLTLAASLIGVTSLIFNVKGNSIGQVLMIVFSLLYVYISHAFGDYGEMLTYVCMSMPMAIFALISWLKNSYKGNKPEVKVNRLKKNEPIVMWLAAAVITLIFYFILKAFNTKNIIPGTIR